GTLAGRAKTAGFWDELWQGIGRQPPEPQYRNTLINKHLFGQPGSVGLQPSTPQNQQAVQRLQGMKWGPQHITPKPAVLEQQMQHAEAAARTLKPGTPPPAPQPDS